LERNGFARVGERLDAEEGRLILWRIDATVDEARLAYDNMYSAIADSPVYRQIIHRAFPDLPEWLIPYSVSPSLALLERIAQALNIGPNSAFIDLACGLGGPGLWVCERTGASLVGVDFSEVGVGAATALARQQGIARASFVNADATHTGLPAKTFDGLMSIDAIQFMDPLGVATEIARLLRPGGVAAVTTMEALVDDLPVATVSKDYRAVFEAAGFSIREYEQIADGERNNALYESIEFYREPLLEEIGEAANPMLEEARDRLERAKAPPRVRKIFLVAQVRA
jgi:ubiquinone/menaquinone biosynthesis C-methylase UbiE